MNAQNYRDTLLPGQEYALLPPTDPNFMTGNPQRIRDLLNNMMNDADSLPSVNPDPSVNQSDTVITDGDRDLEVVDSLFNSFNQRIKHLEQLYLQNQ